MSAPETFEQAERDLQSDDQLTREQAMHCLLFWTGKNQRIHASALPLFQRILSTAKDARMLTHAARGLELIQGAASARDVWLKLLRDPNDDVAASAASAVVPQPFVPELLQLLKRDDAGIQMAAVASLARTKNPEFLSIILPYLDKPDTKVRAILALEQLEDPRALASLEPLIQDMSDSGMTDDRGCRLQIGQLAASATRRLQYVSGKIPPMVATPPQTVLSSSQSATAASSTVPPVAQPHKFSTKRMVAWLPLLPYVPLIAAIVEIPWVILLLIFQLGATKSHDATRLSTHTLDALGLILPLIGLFAALYVVLFRPTRRRAEIVCLCLGSILCGLAALPFGSELFH